MNYMDCMVMVTSVYFSPQPLASLCCVTTDTGLMVFLFTAHLLLVLTVPTHGGMARLS